MPHVSNVCIKPIPLTTRNNYTT